MAPTQTLAIDFTQENSALQVYPQAPLISSKNLAWQGIHLSYYWQPPHETPEYESEQCLVGIHLGQPVVLQQHWRGGQFTKASQVYGDVSIYPIAQPLREAWNADSEFLEIYLTPALLSQVAHESINTDALEILPQPSIRDPLIHQLGLSLKADLESVANEEINKISNCLFAESVATLLAVHLIKQYSSQKPIIQAYSDGLPQYKLRSAIDYIQAHLSEDISLKGLAQDAGMSMHHFSRLFKKSLGYSPALST